LTIERTPCPGYVLGDPIDEVVTLRLVGNYDDLPELERLARRGCQMRDKAARDDVVFLFAEDVEHLVDRVGNPEGVLVVRAVFGAACYGRLEETKRIRH
jgi:hypothetical protein